MRPTGRMVIDTDPGIDDVVTLALAARSPEVQLVAVTTTYGNTDLRAATRNARCIMRQCGRADVPVRPGAARPLRRPLVTAPETHGPLGVGHAPVPPLSPGIGPNPRVLLDTLAAVPSPVTLLTLGPLTNLAHAVTTDPALVRDRVSIHLGMFGNLHERGNTNRWADYNAWCDPEATRIVLEAGLPTQMVGLDVTRRMIVSAAEVACLQRSPVPLRAWLGDAMRFYVEFHRDRERLDGCVVNDVLTLGEVLSPGLLGFERRRLIVNLDEGPDRGHTREVPEGNPISVAMTVDVARMRHLLIRVFGRTWYSLTERQVDHEW